LIPNTLNLFLDVLEKRALSVVKSGADKDLFDMGELDAYLLATEVQVLVRMARNYKLDSLSNDEFDIIRKRTIREVLKSEDEITGFVDPYGET
jgi:hypothetical protein